MFGDFLVVSSCCSRERILLFLFFFLERGMIARFDIGDIVDILIPSYFYKRERELLIKLVESF